MTTNKELAARVEALAAQNELLLGACRRLAAHTEVVAVAVRNPEAVPGPDFAEAIRGLHRLQDDLAGGSFETPPGD